MLTFALERHRSLPQRAWVCIAEKPRHPPRLSAGYVRGRHLSNLWHSSRTPNVLSYSPWNSHEDVACVSRAMGHGRTRGGSVPHGRYEYGANPAKAGA